MFEPTLQVFSFTVLTYTVLMAFAIIIGGGFAIYRTVPEQRLHMMDVLLGGLVGGIALARVQHVLLNWNHFAFHRGEILQVSAGGLDWHGAIIGAGIGMVLMSRWRKVNLTQVVDSLTVLIALLSLALWWGCWTASCRYGLEVSTLADYPFWLVWEGRDIYGIYAPRFHTQLLGMILSCVLILMTLVLFWRRWLYYRRFWLVLLLATSILFFISFLQGDTSLRVNHFRLSQYFDGIFIIFSAYMTMR